MNHLRPAALLFALFLVMPRPAGSEVLAVGPFHAVAVKADGTVWSWGDNSRNQLGYDTQRQIVASPRQVPGLSGIVAVAASRYTSVALDAQGRAWYWGDTVAAPVLVSHAQFQSIKAVDLQIVNCGGEQAEIINGLTVDGTVVGMDLLTGAAFRITGFPGPVKALSARGAPYNVALLADGTVWGWAGCSFDPYFPSRTAAKPLQSATGPLAGVTAVATNYRGLMTATSGGLCQFRVLSNGPDYWCYPQFGIFERLSAQGEDLFAVDAAGSLWGWSTNQQGQLTRDPRSGFRFGFPSEAPTLILPVGNVRALGVSGAFILAAGADGDVWGWGLNISGQLGRGMVTSSAYGGYEFAPAPIPNFSLIVPGLPPAPVLTTPSVIAGTVGVRFTLAMTATNSPTAYGATGLPAGLALDASTGTISGTPTTAGVFTVTLSASNRGGTGSKPLVLTIAAAADVTPPSITVQPSSQTIASGQAATVSVSAAGAQPLAYQWYLGTSPSTAAPIAGATSSTYTTPAQTSAGSYWVRVSNAFGVANSATAVIAISPTTGSATARYVRTDTTTRGSWKGTYGLDGYDIAGDAARYPSYAQVAATVAGPHVWAGTSTDPRALERAAAGRLAATWYGSTMTLDVNLTDGRPHQVALYLLDWDAQGRAATVEVIDAATGALLDRRTATAFGSGQYWVWTVTGRVKFRLIGVSGPNAVASGLFFDTTESRSTAAYVRTDTTTRGSWKGTYGQDGYDIAGDAPRYPSYVQVTATVAGPHVWAGTSTDPRALERPAAGRLAAAWYGSTMTLDVNLTDGQSHQVALYLLDWDAQGRAATVEVIDAATGALLDRRTATAFGSGQYWVWTVSGRVKFRLIGTSGPNAVVSGVFFH